MPPLAIKRSLVTMIPEIAMNSIGTLREIAATVGVEPSRLMSTCFAASARQRSSSGRKLDPFDLGPERFLEHAVGLADDPRPRSAEPTETHDLGLGSRRGWDGAAKRRIPLKVQPQTT